MKIVHTVESYLPDHHGMAEVVRQLSEGLVQRGHQVIVLTSLHPRREKTVLINGVLVISFDISGNLIKGIKGDADEYIQYILNEKYDVLTNFAAQQWATDLCFPILSQIKAKTFFVPTGFSALNNPSYKLYFEKMTDWMRQYNSNIFLSENYQDFKFAVKHAVQNLIIISNGASKAEFENLSLNFSIREYLKLSEFDRVILHVGSYTGLKGHDEAIEIFLKSKFSNAVLVFIGQNFNEPSGLFYRMHFNWFKEIWDLNALRFRTFKILIKYFKLFISGKRKKIFGISLPRQKLIAAFKQSDIMLFPSLIECSPVVIFEAMASSLPVLASPVGNVKEIIENSNCGNILKPISIRGGLTYPDIKQGAAQLDQMLADSDSLKNMGESGNKFWENNFTWEKILIKYEKLYSQ